MTGRRTPAEQKVYEASLVDLELWYAHQMTTVIILSTSVPHNQPGYASHGWQLFENGVARLLKTYRSDLWPPVIDVGDRLRTRHPPLSLDDFSLRLSTSFLSLETDRPIVPPHAATPLVLQVENGIRERDEVGALRVRMFGAAEQIEAQRGGCMRDAIDGKPMLRHEAMRLNTEHIQTSTQQ